MSFPWTDFGQTNSRPLESSVRLNRLLQGNSEERGDWEQQDAEDLFGSHESDSFSNESGCGSSSTEAANLNPRAASSALQRTEGFGSQAEPPKQDYQKKFKTEMCKNFELLGRCRWGAACSFAHGPAELRKKTHLNSKYRSKICRKYHSEGSCSYGQRCQYFHVKDSYQVFLGTFLEVLKIREQESRPDSLDLAAAIAAATHL